VVGRVFNIEMTFLLKWRVRVGLFEEDGMWRLCEFNASVSA
jgi:hypothetical protein